MLHTSNACELELDDSGKFSQPDHKYSFLLKGGSFYTLSKIARGIRIGKISAAIQGVILGVPILDLRSSLQCYERCGDARGHTHPRQDKVVRFANEDNAGTGYMCSPETKLRSGNNTGQKLKS